MRTYTKLTFEEATAAWKDFGPEWRWLKDISWERGFPYPPSGTAHDDREVAEPSQRAVVYRALRDNPTQLRAIVSRSRSWHGVIDQIFGLEERLRGELGERVADDAWSRKDEPNPRQSMTAVGAIFDRVAESLGYVRRDP